MKLVAAPSKAAFKWPALFAVLTIGLAGCGAAPAPFTSSSSGARTVSSSPLQTSPSPGYRTYTSAKWLYSLSYPATWYDLDNFGAPDSQKYFSNENVEAPTDLSATGIWLTIEVDSQPTKPCQLSTATSSPGPTQVQTSLDGEATVELVAPKGAALKVLHSAWCYYVGFNTTSDQDRTQQSNEMTQILSSFRFNR